MNLDDLPPKHRANAERQMREMNERRAHLVMPHPGVSASLAPAESVQLGPKDFVKVRKELASAERKSATRNGFSPIVLTAWLLDHGIYEPHYEFQFHVDRKWRFDLAWTRGGDRLALEVQGGLFPKRGMSTGGAHVRGAALLREHDKLNEAAALRWRILYRTPSNLMTAATAELIRKALA